MLIYATTTLHQEKSSDLSYRTVTFSEDEAIVIQSSVRDDDDHRHQIYPTPTLLMDESGSGSEIPYDDVIVSSILNTNTDDWTLISSSIQNQQNSINADRCLTPNYPSSSIQPSLVQSSVDLDDHRQWNNVEMESSTSSRSANNSEQSSKSLQNIPSDNTGGQNALLIPLMIGTACIVTIGIILVVLYGIHQKGRRRKVYLSHPGAPPKDFAEDTGVRSPVLLPDEIQMLTVGQTATSSGTGNSLRVRRAVVLATDPINDVAEVESESTVGTEESGVRSSVAECATSLTPPPPPPYRTPPPYPPSDSLPDMIIRNVHAK